MVMDDFLDKRTDTTPRVGLRREIDTIIWDIDERRFLIRVKDGRMFEAAAPLNDDPERAIVRVVYFWHARHIVFETNRGDHLLGVMPSRHNLAPVGGRPVVYLDQNHWSTLAKTSRAPDRVPEAERKAALELIALAEAGKIILPISAGHHSETSHWVDDDSRYQLALTMLRLSKGWQMRDPLAIWADELQRDIATHAGAEPSSSPPVFTLEPWVIHDAKARCTVGPDDSTQPGLPADLEFAFQSALSTIVYFDLLLNTAPIRREASHGWRAKQQRTTDALAADHRPKAQKRQIAYALALDDLSHEMAKAAAHTNVSTVAFDQWVRSIWNKEMIGTPAVAMFRSMFVDKHLNPRTTWQDNDLNDLFYLSAAAGYANHIVAERHTTGLIAQSSKRLNAPVAAHRSITDLIANLTLAR
ncbi:hypothetical protein Q9S36_03225 [Microbacterium sp. ARD31]|uniref:hypothetical protein n=1 Tax=Microbacterium sp. ARD31 TaxID=2962576 RepID=UPI002882858A|nr:hypothetical protein [Microbacterium sp. ARD31]MDT0179220.1 hypothetical protein [Microbacterium sp. ARD31]